MRWSARLNSSLASRAACAAWSASVAASRALVTAASISHSSSARVSLRRASCAAARIATVVPMRAFLNTRTSMRWSARLNSSLASRAACAAWSASVAASRALVTAASISHSSSANRVSLRRASIEAGEMGGAATVANLIRVPSGVSANLWGQPTGGLGGTLPNGVAAGVFTNAGHTHGGMLLRRGGRDVRPPHANARTSHLG